MDDKRIKNNDVLQNIVLENREKISISGVENVETFNENSIVLFTQLGLLTIDGNDLHIDKLNVDTGEILIGGEIDSIIYSNDTDRVNKGGFWSKLFQ